MEAQTAIGILGTGSYLPAETVSNQVVAERAGVTAEWIQTKTDIRSRRYAAEHEATSDLAAAAARAALAAAGIAAGQLKWIVVATSTPDHPQPATACLVQAQIGAHAAAAFDINSVCSGFVFALVTAARLVAADGADSYGLVIGADVYSRIIDPTDRRTAILFGDGAGAVVLGPVRPGHGLVGAHLRSDGELHDMVHVPAGGSREPASEKTVADRRHYFQMKGRAVSDYVLSELPKVVRTLLDAHDVAPAEVDHFIPHQANGVMLRKVLPGLGLPRAQVHLMVAEHGNTGAASVAVALDVANRQGAFRDGELLLLAGFGGGISFGAALVRWQAGR
ncbi:3-oxoacyl-ACP synthase III family protein [Kutzneria chonburiensis]|uniref:3-oxoacyl-ACP synthase III family protein n=1 Tax=Kutzneria chonburiensis TaxID=1483604 RepID=A0ABV6MNR0_9PSEU|nr:beta-ketoacyl-ACP synthase 3 [Kutzneria chonburiensis]